MREIKNKELKTNLFLMIASVIFCFLLLEAIFIIADNYNYGHSYIPHKYDDNLGWKFIPNTSGHYYRKEFDAKYNINSDGFADDDFSVNKNVNEKRIFIFGDSFMAAMEVDITNTTHMLLEKKLKESDENFEVYNFGIPGYGTDQYMVALKKYAPIYKPDIVIFSMLTANDLKNIDYDMESEKCKPFFKLNESKLELIPFDCDKTRRENIRFLRKSNVLDFIYRQISVIRIKSSINDNKKQIPINFYIYESGNPKFNDSFLLNEKIILEAKKYCQTIGSEFVLVVLTNSVQIDEEKWNKTMEEYPLMKDKVWNLEYPEERINQSCKKDSINCLFLLEPFKEHTAQTGDKMHWYYDSHWNDKGHKLAAEEIHHYLITKII